MDPLGEALHFLRMSGVFYCRSELTAPWALELPPFEGCLSFHAVTGGRCWLSVEGAEDRVLEEGDLALVPHGRGHCLWSEPGIPATRIEALPHEHVNDRYAILRHGGGGPRTNLVCGAVRFDHPAAHYLVTLLPRVIHIEASSSPQMDWIRSTLRLMADEAKELRPGGETVITRLSDILVIQAIRSWIEQDPAAQTGWLGALSTARSGPLSRSSTASPRALGRWLRSPPRPRCQGWLSRRDSPISSASRSCTTWRASECTSLGRGSRTKTSGSERWRGVSGISPRPRSAGPSNGFSEFRRDGCGKRERRIDGLKKEANALEVSEEDSPRRGGLPRLRPRRHSGRAHEASQEDQGHSTHGDRGHQLPDPDFKHHGSVVAFAAFPDDCSFFVMRATLPMAFIEAAIVARREGFATLVLRRALRKPRRRGEARIRARAYPQRGQGVHDSERCGAIRRLRATRRAESELVSAMWSQMRSRSSAASVVQRTRISRDNADPCERRLRHGRAAGLRERRDGPGRPHAGTIRRDPQSWPRSLARPDRPCVRSPQPSGLALLPVRAEPASS